MKREEFKNCAFCRKGIGNNGCIDFYVMQLKYMVIDPGAVLRQSGLETILGSPALAQVMGPQEDLAVIASEVKGIVICANCAEEPNLLSAVMECTDDV